MIRAEKMTQRDAIQHEIDTYNELIPAAGELAATVLIEYAEPRERDAVLVRLVGLERHLWLKIGPQRIAARFDDRQMSDESISAVQFVRFSVEGVDAALVLELAAKREVAVEADHPSLAARGAIGGLLAASLAENLPGDCAGLVHKRERRIRSSGFGARRLVRQLVNSSADFLKAAAAGTPAGQRRPGSSLPGPSRR